MEKPPLGEVVEINRAMELRKLEWRRRRGGVTREELLPDPWSWAGGRRIRTAR